MNKISNLTNNRLNKIKYDFFLIFNNTNLTYFTSFPGATALLVPKQGESTLYVSSVNYEQAKAETNGLIVELLKRGENLMEKIANHTVSNKKTSLHRRVSQLKVGVLWLKLLVEKKNLSLPATLFGTSE